MKVLHFLFLLGVCFTVFEFLWGLFKLTFNFATSSIQSPVKTNSVRIIKYILFSTVIVQFIQIVNADPILIGKQSISITISAVLILFYLIGKFQNRAAFVQIKGLANQFLKGILSTFDSKLEIALIFGSIGLFILGSIFPTYISNPVTNWFAAAIINIYNTPFFGFIFMVIAAFVLMNTLSRGANIIGKLISGESFANATKKESKIFERFNAQGFNRSNSQNSIPNEPEFTEYEEVTDDEESAK
ncbi:MAG: hypothetical protein AB8B74_02335 [Crocinitomicaceae bacterium]